MVALFTLLILDTDMKVIDTKANKNIITLEIEDSDGKKHYIDVTTNVNGMSLTTKDNKSHLYPMQVQHYTK